MRSIMYSPAIRGLMPSWLKVRRMRLFRHEMAKNCQEDEDSDQDQRPFKNAFEKRSKHSIDGYYSFLSKFSLFTCIHIGDVRLQFGKSNAFVNA